MPQAAEVLSQPRADEAILTPQADAAVPSDAACGDDPGPDEPQDPELLEIDRQIEAIEITAGEAAREQEQREQASKARHDQERRQQLEEPERRYEAFVATRRNPPDPGEHDDGPSVGGGAGRAPPDQG
jgi:hypothetical protein